MIVVDTNVTSELMRTSPSPAVAAWVGAQSPSDLYTTAVTVAEISYGLARLPEGGRKERLVDAAREVFSAFAEQVLPFDTAAAIEYAAVVIERERRGTPINGFDAQIASICRTRNATLATRNVKDFERTGVDLVNPWGGSPEGQRPPSKIRTRTAGAQVWSLLGVPGGTPLVGRLAGCSGVVRRD